MPTYGIMHDDGTFEPLGQAPQYAPAQGQVAYSAYNQQPQSQQWQGQGYRANIGRQRQYQQWQGNGYRVNVGQPRFSGNGYAPRGYNTNMNYGPWYGQQSYAAYPPCAPYQPRYEWMPGSNGQPVAVRLGEYQREQPVAYETMYNSQGIPVRVPVYAPMNNSAMPVRVGVSPDGQPYGSANVNYQAVFPQRATQQRTTQRRQQVQQRNVSTPIADGTSTVIKNDYDMPTRNITQSSYDSHAGIDSDINSLAIDNFSTRTPVEANTSISLATSRTPTTERESLINEEFNRIRASQELALEQGTTLVKKTEEDIMNQAIKRVDKMLEKQRAQELLDEYGNLAE